MRRVRSNRTLGRARPRLLELLENSLVCTKEENEEKKARNLARRKKEEAAKKAAEEAETMVGGLKDFVID